MSAFKLKAQIKEIGMGMVGKFYQTPLTAAISYYSFTQEGDMLFLHQNMAKISTHHHRDRQRFARLVSAVLYATGAKGSWYDDGSFGFSLKSLPRRAAKRAS